MLNSYDVVIVGGGNAALCAAITAATAGARVLILEAAPKEYRGGNSRHTRNFRCMHEGPLSVLTGHYDEEEYYNDLLLVTKGNTDEHLARIAIRGSQDSQPWMEAHGVRFQAALSGTLSLSRTNAFFLGGGKALVNAYYRRAEALGVKVRYGAHVDHLELEGDQITRVDFNMEGKKQSLSPKAIIIATGARPRILPGMEPDGDLMMTYFEGCCQTNENSHQIAGAA